MTCEKETWDTRTFCDVGRERTAAISFRSSVDRGMQWIDTLLNNVNQCINIDVYEKKFVFNVAFEACLAVYLGKHGQSRHSVSVILSSDQNECKRSLHKSRKRFCVWIRISYFSYRREVMTSCWFHKWFCEPCFKLLVQLCSRYKTLTWLQLLLGTIETRKCLRLLGECRAASSRYDWPYNHPPVSFFCFTWA